MPSNGFYLGVQRIRDFPWGLSKASGKRWEFRKLSNKAALGASPFFHLRRETCSQDFSKQNASSNENHGKTLL
jgi:hypothetical protein